MPQVIHTGNELKTPQDRGYAMQALSQFGQQEQARKTYELESQRKDRDKFADMIKLDPVYVTNKNAQDRVAKIMDDFMGKLTLFNKDAKGMNNMTALTYIQQEMGLAKAEMQYIKGASDRLTQAIQLDMQNPGKYNTRLIDAARKQWDEEGTLPEGPLAIPEWQNPENRLAEGAKSFQQRSRYVPQGEYVDGQRQMKLLYPNEASMPQGAVVDKFLNDDFEKRNNFGYFADKIYHENKPEYDYWMKQADNDEQKAAVMRLRANAQPVYPEAGYTDYKTTSASSDAVQIKSDGSAWDGKNKLFGYQQNVPVSDGTLENAIVFNRPMAVKNIIDLPARSLQLTDGIQTKSGMVQARVHAADNNKTYVVVDKNSLDKISFTKSAMEAFGKDSFTKDESGAYRIKEGAEDDVMIPINTQDARGLIDNWTSNKFSDQLRQLPEAKAPAKKKRKFGIGTVLRSNDVDPRVTQFMKDNNITDEAEAKRILKESGRL